MAVASESTRLAKLTRPRLYDAVQRERLFDRIDALRRRPVLWVAAPPGAGKTTLVASYLEARRIDGIWCQVDAGDADPASLFYYLGLAEKSLPGRPKKLADLPLCTPEHLADVAGFSRRFFRQLFARLGVGTVLVFDNFQEADERPEFNEVMRAAIQNVPESVCMVVVSRHGPPDAYADLVANRVIATLDAEAVRLSREESGKIARLHHAIEDDRVVDRLHERCGGWAAGLILLTERLRRGATLGDLSASESLQEVFSYFAGQLFDRADAHNRRMLLQLSYPQAISASLAQALTGETSAPRLLDQLYRRHLFTDRRKGEEPIYQFHALFREFLQHRAGEELDDAQQHFAACHAAGLLEASEQYEDAMRLWMAACEWERARDLVLAQASRLIAQGRWRLVEDWIAALPGERVRSDRWLLYWRGAAWTGVNPPHARAIFEQCHRAASEAGDGLCEVQAAAGMVEAYFLEYAVFTPLDRWIPVLEKMFDLPEGVMDLNAELRAQSAMLIALVYRMPDHPRIDHCVRRVDELLRTGADVNLRVTAATHLTLYGSFTGRLQVSKRAAAQLTPLLSDAAVTVFRRVFAWAVINWYACNATDVALGDQAVAGNLAIARDEGLHIAERFACIIGFYYDMDQRRVESARERLLRFEEIMDPSQPYEMASLVNMKSWLGVYTEDPSLPLQHGVRAYELYVEAGSIPHIFMGLTGLIWGTVESGDHVAGRRWIREHRQRSDRINLEWSRGGPDAAEAIMALREGDSRTLDDRLNRIFACDRTRMDQYGHMLAWCRSWASILAATAMERGIQVPRALAFVREFGLDPPRPDLEIWPWPVKIRCLGPFSIHVNGEPLAFGVKTPRKLLSLLKAIVALGGKDVPERKLVDALWPDEDGDTAHQSYTTALHRLRRLLGSSDLIRQRAGRVSLDAGCVWVDALAFEAATAGRPARDLSQAAHLIPLYGGTFLPDEEDAPWAFSMREKLRMRYLDLVSASARQLEQQGRIEEALELYRRGIETDELAETFHQGLMRCHHQVGRTPEALEAYRRMRELLARAHGIQPSPATEELFRKLSGS